MYKGKGIHLVLISSFILTLCLLIITLGTYALFSEKVVITTHLKAGTLDIKLIRDNLKYNVLDDKGMLLDIQNNQDKDFTNTNTKSDNIFDLNDNVKLVPGNYYEATMILKNTGDVAFDYWLEINLTKGSNTNLSKQIKITVKSYENTNEKEYIRYLNEGIEIGNEKLPLDSVFVNEEKTFKVKVEFIHDNMNNSAMEEEVNFDLTVYAVQKTNK